MNSVLDTGFTDSINDAVTLSHKRTSGKQFRAGLIGLGQIAQGYGTPEEAAPYCHAGGLAQSQRVRLVAAVDPQEQAHAAFQSKWGPRFADSTGPVKGYFQVEQMLEAEALDVVGVCVPGPRHFDVVKALLTSEYCPRVIFLEKPPFCSLEETDNVVTRAKERQVAITVSYSRHWAPHVLRLQELVHDGLIGRVQSVVGYCGGTVLSFASHTTDLICQFACAGTETYSPQHVTASGVPHQTPGEVPQAFVDRGYEPEPALGCMLIEFENGVSGVQIGGSGEHGQFYADVFGDKGRVRAGIYIPPAVFDRDNQPVDLSAYDFPPETSVFHRAYDQIAAYLDGGDLPDCTDFNWHQVNEIGFSAIESIRGAGRVAVPCSHRSRRIFANG